LKEISKFILVLTFIKNCIIFTSMKTGIILEQILFDFTLSSERTCRFCAYPRVSLLSKPVPPWQSVRGGTSFGRCAARFLAGQAIICSMWGTLLITMMHMHTKVTGRWLEGFGDNRFYNIYRLFFSIYKKWNIIIYIYKNKCTF